MASNKIALWIGVLIFLQFAAVAVASDHTPDVTLYYTCNTWGELDPCFN